MRLISCLLLYVLFFQANAQGYYVCYFKDKPHEDISSYALSKKSIERKQLRLTPFDNRDYPVYNTYLDSVASKAFVKMTSRWLNAVLVYGDEQDKNNLENLSFVDSISFLTQYSGGVQQFSSANIEGEDVVLNQNILEDINEKGSGVSIAVFDGGFLGVNAVEAFQPLFNENRIKTYNLLDTNSVYRYHKHGTQVVSIIGSTDFGIAPKADFYLFTTEAVQIESRLEEFYWLKAAEMADSIGVDIINSSLGYNYEHDFKEEDYSKKDLDGKTSLIAMAASISVEKGMVVVTTAGNEGESDWQTLTTPGDVESIITVGSIDSDLNKSSFSSVGPTADGRSKPDICAKGSNVRTLNNKGVVVFDNGTSFSAPVVTSICALILEHYPSYSPEKVKKELLRLGHLYPVKNNDVGFGAIDIEKLLDLVGLSTSILGLNELKEMKNVFLYSVTGQLVFEGNGKNIELTQMPLIFLGLVKERGEFKRVKVFNYLGQGN